MGIMTYIIYKTTNLINGKYYIGKHKTNNIHDGYMGSGLRLQRAIQKYGIDNFSSEIIIEVKNEKELNLAERIFVIPDKEINYNLTKGGHGSWSHNHNQEIYKKISESHRKNPLFIEKGRILGNSNKGRKHSEEINKKKGRTGAANGMYGKKHKPETIEKIRVAAYNRSL